MTSPKQGGFRFAGGLFLISRDTDRLHGLSDLLVDPGGELISESDDGDLLQARLILDQAGRLVGLSEARLRPLTGEDGRPLPNKAEGDAEGLAKLPNGDLLVSFEQRHRIWRYSANGSPPVEVDRPAVSLPDNGGMEGLSLAPSQGPDAYWAGVEDGRIFLCRFGKGCLAKPNLPRPPLGYRLSGLRETPDGHLILLHHQWMRLTGSKLSLSMVGDPAGAPRVVDTLTLAPPAPTDNFEGVAAVAAPGGGLRLYLISDDNFSDSQRTLLLAFDWTPSR